MSTAFDTLKLSRRLETFGFSHEQATGMAEVLADALDAELVTRDYLDSRLGETKAELKADIAEVKTQVARLEGKIETDIARMGTRLIMWMVGMTIAVCSVLATLAGVAVTFWPTSP